MKPNRFAAIALAAVLCCGCAPKQPPTKPTIQTVPVPQTAPTETTAPPATAQTVPKAAIAVDTPCGTVYLPDQWDTPIRTELELGDPMVLTFLAEETALYELTFSESAAGCIGVAQTEDGPIYVGMRLHPLPEQSNQLLSMQESVNQLLEQLQLSPVTSAEEPANPDLLLETDYGILKFPRKWEEYLKIEQTDYDGLEFYCVLPGHEPVLLFMVLFHSEDGEILSAITDEDGTRTILSLYAPQLDLGDQWSAWELDLIYSMQEDMNYLLNALQP